MQVLERLRSKRMIRYQRTRYIALLSLAGWTHSRTFRPIICADFAPWLVSSLVVCRRPGRRRKLCAESSLTYLCAVQKEGNLNVQKEAKQFSSALTIFGEYGIEVRRTLTYASTVCACALLCQTNRLYIVIQGSMLCMVYNIYLHLDEAGCIKSFALPSIRMARKVLLIF